MRQHLLRLSSVLALAGAACLGQAASAQAPELYPAFCQGMAIDGGDNRMFVSGTFAYPQKAPPEGGTLREGTAPTEFAREVKRRSGKDLLDSTCHTRPTAEEIDSFAESTVRANGAGWTVEKMDWMPAGARRLTSAVDAATAEAAPPAESPAAPVAAPRSEAAAARAAAIAAAAQRAAEQRAAEEARTAAARQADAERLQELNARALKATEEQKAKIEAEKRAHEERMRAFNEKQQAFEAEQQAYEKAKAEQQRQVAAAEQARRQWEADVAACNGGDRSRCAKN